MAEATLAILLFIAILGVTTLICGVWVFYKGMRGLGRVVGILLRTVVGMLQWLTVGPRRGVAGTRVVTTDGVYSLPGRSSRGAGLRPRHGSAMSPRPGVASSLGMVRCPFHRCLAPNPPDASYCRRCGHVSARQPQRMVRPLAATSA